MISAAHQRLRDATRDDHQRLETRSDVLGKARTAEGRRALVEAFWSLHADAEAALTPWLACVPGLDFDGRRRTAHLACDLVVVGGRAPEPRRIAVGGRAEALGLMYVLEGSTLGGRLIRRQVTGEGGDMAGLGFLDPYGDRVGERWRSFLAVIDAEARASSDTEAMVAGARAGFRHAEQRLCAAPGHG